MKETKVNRDNYIALQGWMITDLNLKGNELIIYACIYGFSQAENQTFNGSLQYLADWTNSTKQSVVKCLKSLVDKGYIIKEEKYLNNVKFCEYYATKFNTLLNKVEYPMQQSLTGGVQQSLTNTIPLNNKENNIDDNIVKSKKFTAPTIEEIQSYCIERNNNVDAERFYDYYESNGWQVGKSKMKNWKAAVRTWEKNNFNNKTSAPVKSSNPFLDMLKEEEVY